MVNDGAVEGIDNVTRKPRFCKPCVLAKSKKLPFKHRGQKATHPFQIIHSDVGGPVTPADRHGNRYWISFIDGFGCLPWIYFMKKKSEAFARFCEFKNDVKNLFKMDIGELNLSENFVSFFQSDGGGEYIRKRFQSELGEAGIVHLTTAPDTPEQNGLAERMNQTLVNTATAMLIESGLSRSYWSDAMQTAATIISRTPAAGLKGKVPYTVVFGRKADISWFRPFGSVTYALIPKDQREGKFSDKARKAILIGYSTEKKAYKLLDVSSKKEFSSRHVRFDESGGSQAENVDLTDKNMLAGNAEPKWKPNFLQPHRNNARHAPAEPETDDKSCDKLPAEPVEVNRNTPLSLHPEERAPPPGDATLLPAASSKRKRAPDAGSVGDLQPAVRERSTRTRKAANRNADYYRAVQLQEQRQGDRQAEKRARLVNNSVADSSEHVHRTLLDIQARADNPELSDLSDLPESEDDVFFDTNNSPEPDEAFFAGILQSGPSSSPTPQSAKEAFEGPNKHHWESALQEEIQNLIDNNVYKVVPVPRDVKPITSKMVFRIKHDANGNIKCHKIRIVARGFTQVEGVDYKEVWAPVANLESIRIILALAVKYNLELDQMDVATAYLNGELEEEIYMMPPDGVKILPGHCWRLKRSLYGLKQAGRTWNLTLDKKLRGLSFSRLNAETCLYVCRQGDRVCFLVVYVDDFLLAANSRSFMNDIKRKLSATFKMRDLGPASYILGIHITRN